MIIHNRNTVLWLLSSLSVACLALFSGQPVSAADSERPTMRGDVAYAEPVKFDYNQDGTLKTVQLWASFEVKPAVGKEGEPGYLPEEGYIRRYMKDLALGAPVIGYSQFNMLPDSPLGERVPAVDIQLTGDRAIFRCGGLLYTIVNGGEGVVHDSITVNNGVREYPVHLLDGYITVDDGK